MELNFKAVPNDIAIEDLPAGLAEIARNVGLTAALELAITWGGTRLYIPKQMPEDHPIAVQVGCEAASKLAAYYGSTSITPPKNAFAKIRQARFRASVVREFYSGKTASELARKYNLHENTIYNWAHLSGSDC